MEVVVVVVEVVVEEVVVVLLEVEGFVIVDNIKVVCLRLLVVRLGEFPFKREIYF